MIRLIFFNSIQLVLMKEIKLKTDGYNFLFLYFNNC